MAKRLFRDKRDVRIRKKLRMTAAEHRRAYRDNDLYASLDKEFGTSMLRPRVNPWQPKKNGTKSCYMK